MGQYTPLELIKIKQVVINIQEFPAKIDSLELAKNARQLLKKYALLSEKIEINVLTTSVHRNDLAKIRTEEFKALRRKLKEKANSILHAKNNEKAPSEKMAKKTVKKPTSKKTAAAVDVPVAKEKTQKSRAKSSSKPKKATASKDGA